MARRQSAGEIITHGQGQQQDQPENASSDEDPGEPAAVPHVHEEEDDQQRFTDGDGERDEGVEGAAQIEEGDADRKER